MRLRTALFVLLATSLIVGSFSLGDGYLPKIFVLDTEEPETGSWGAWSEVSLCSRSCGGGVAHQIRQCLDVDDDGADLCTGANKRFFSCNLHECPEGSKDLRAEQCASYNDVAVDGVYYDWTSHTGGSNKCELICIALGASFFHRRSNENVIDGTPCSEKNDVCVEGKCIHVGCDASNDGSNAKEDACRECGGNGIDCYTVKESVNMDNFQVGYNDIVVIPAGATNIVIREVNASNNYLAIRNTTGHYYLNGNFRIGFPGSLRFAGTIFHYERNYYADLEKITALGPTNEDIYVVVLYVGSNVDVDCEYSIPKRFSLQPVPSSYTWITDEFSKCSHPCGGGYRSRRVSCVRRRDNEPVDDNLCDRLLVPADTESCSEEPCPAEVSTTNFDHYTSSLEGSGSGDGESTLFADDSTTNFDHYTSSLEGSGSGDGESTLFADDSTTNFDHYTSSLEGSGSGDGESTLFADDSTTNFDHYTPSLEGSGSGDGESTLFADDSTTNFDDYTSSLEGSGSDDGESTLFAEVSTTNFDDYTSSLEGSGSGSSDSTVSSTWEVTVQDICNQPPLLGECNNWTTRWYYESYEQRCIPYYYGGCGGNENNFQSEDDCINQCESVV